MKRFEKEDSHSDIKDDGDLYYRPRRKLARFIAFDGHKRLAIVDRDGFAIQRDPNYLYYI